MVPEQKKTLLLSAAAVMLLSAPLLSAFAFTTTMGHPLSTYCLYFTFALILLAGVFLVIALKIKT
ncbi:hypothetical protein [Taibaiella chishuiensis]|uniref:hypothetical protein n=1 Tax=Taibaiella chishuiensis TaxID=1434707 RepID=UPI000D0E25D2|nr:hypothetical protein [Taibaiella chishuiensis]